MGDGATMTLESIKSRILGKYAGMPIDPSPEDTCWYAVNASFWDEIQNSRTKEEVGRSKIRNAPLLLRHVQQTAEALGIAEVLVSPEPTSAESGPESVESRGHHSSSSSRRMDRESLDIDELVAAGGFQDRKYEFINGSMWDFLTGDPPEGQGFQYDVKIPRAVYSEIQGIYKVEHNPLTIRVFTLRTSSEGEGEVSSLKCLMPDSLALTLGCVNPDPTAACVEVTLPNVCISLYKHPINISRSRRWNDLLDKLRSVTDTTDQEMCPIIFTRDNSAYSSSTLDNPWNALSTTTPTWRECKISEFGIDDATEILVIWNTEDPNCRSAFSTATVLPDFTAVLHPAPKPTTIEEFMENELDLPGGEAVQDPVQDPMLLDQDIMSFNLSSMGLRGLQNLGNTCFMNSALQCICHTMPLVVYFLDGTFKKDINTTNPLGTGGKLVMSFAQFLQSLWTPSSVEVENGKTSIAPRALKRVIGEFAPCFSGYAQQDAQELISFLLDGLHEDCNRIKQKPFVENVEDTEGRKDDKTLADEAWSRHKLRDDSIIVDLFQGMYRSRLECQYCHVVSKTFDPFMYLSLPIPQYRTFACRVVLMPSTKTIPWPADCAAMSVSPLVLFIEIDFRMEPLEASLLALHQASATEQGTSTMALSRTASYSSVFNKSIETLSWPLQELIEHQGDSIRLKIFLACLEFYVSWVPQFAKDRNKLALYQCLHNNAVFVELCNRLNSSGGTQQSSSRQTLSRALSCDRVSKEVRGAPEPGVSRFKDLPLASVNSVLKNIMVSGGASNSETVTPVWTPTPDLEDADFSLISNYIFEIEVVVSPTDVHQDQLNNIYTNGLTLSCFGEESGMHLLAVLKPARLAAKDAARTRSEGHVSEFISANLIQSEDKFYVVPMLMGIKRSSGADPLVVAESFIRVVMTAYMTLIFPEQQVAAIESFSKQDYCAFFSRNVKLQMVKLQTTRHLPGSPERVDGHYLYQAFVVSILNIFESLSFRSLQEDTEYPIDRLVKDTKFFSNISWLLLLFQNMDSSPIHEKLTLETSRIAPLTYRINDSMFDGTCRMADQSRFPDDGLSSPFVSYQTSKYMRYGNEKDRIVPQFLSLLKSNRTITIEECLEEFISMECLSDNNEWYCPRCKTHRNATKKIDYWKLPKILIISLKRFSQISRSRNKLETNVQFGYLNDELLDFSSLLIPSAFHENRYRKYSLYGISDHFGGLGGGHYTARVKCCSTDNDSNGQWHCFDDTFVSPVALDKDSFNTSSAYILFYRQEDTE